MIIKLIWKRLSHSQGLWYYHTPCLEKSRIIVSYQRDKDEWNNTEQGNIFTYNSKNALRSLLHIGTCIIFPPKSEINFRSRRMQLIKLAMVQCRTHNCSIKNTIWHQTGGKKYLHYRVQIGDWIICVVLDKNGIIYWK